MDSYINISKSCIIRKDKYYVFFNVLKFKEYIVYVMNMNMIKMLNYQFIIQLLKVFT